MTLVSRLNSSPNLNSATCVNTSFQGSVYMSGEGSGCRKFVEVSDFVLFSEWPDGGILKPQVESPNPVRESSYKTRNENRNF